jgi:hypothetical protein
MMLTYSQQPEYRRVVRRRRDKRDRAELHTIRAAVRSKKPITAGPNVPRHKGAWSVEDEAHAVRLRALGFALDQIALVIQRTTAGVERRLWLLRKGRPRQTRKIFLRDDCGRFAGSAEARS